MPDHIILPNQGVKQTRLHTGIVVRRIILIDLPKKNIISSMRSESDYAQLLDEFGVRRTSPAFWQQSDAFHAAFEQNAPVAYGLFDYGRLENR